jgi:hypothetical protein
MKKERMCVTVKMTQLVAIGIRTVERSERWLRVTPSSGSCSCETTRARVMEDLSWVTKAMFQKKRWKNGWSGSSECEGAFFEVVFALSEV